MIKYLFRHNKDYSRFNIIKKLLKDLELKNDIFILLPFSKNQFFKNFFKRDKLINDFFISNYDTYVFDRKKITNKNPRAWWKYFLFVLLQQKKRELLLIIKIATTLFVLKNQDQNSTSILFRLL